MAENAGLENHRIKSFKNKGRDVEVSLEALLLLTDPTFTAVGTGVSRGFFFGSDYAVNLQQLFFSSSSKSGTCFSVTCGAAGAAYEERPHLQR